jgi:hypothetical protein
MDESEGMLAGRQKALHQALSPVIAMPRTNCFDAAAYKIITGTTVSIEPAAYSS